MYYLFINLRSFLKLVKVGLSTNNLTRINDGAGAGGGVKSESTRRNVDDFTTDSNPDQIDIIQRRPSRVAEERRILNPLRLSHWPEPQRPRKASRFEAGKAVGECGLVQTLGLRQERQ